MTSKHEQVFAARLGNLPATAAFIEDFCAAHDLAHDDVLRLTLVVEELFTNTIVHGHGGDCDAHVRLALSLVQTQLVLHYEDRAPAFDPRQFLAGAAPTEPIDIDAREPGGWGLRMVADMAHGLEHEAVDGGNLLRIVLLRQG